RQVGGFAGCRRLRLRPHTRAPEPQKNIQTKFKKFNFLIEKAHNHQSLIKKNHPTTQIQKYRFRGFCV
ncbi:hypothetical protein, partial [Enterobacter mori]